MPGASLVCLQGICKRFRGADRPPALDGVSLDVAEGRIHGVIGRSGAGKSTLIRCVNLLERPDGGRVLVGGQDMMALGGSALAEARRGIGMVFQHFNLLSARTVADNVALPLEIAGVAGAERRARVADLLGLVGLTDRAGAYPAALSGGQKQRVGIARALASRPRLLLCDEATSALDPETTADILALIRGSAAGHEVVRNLAECVGPLLGRHDGRPSGDHRASVVRRAVEGRAGEDDAVEVGDRHRDGDARRAGVEEEATAGRAVQ